VVGFSLPADRNRPRPTPWDSLMPVRGEPFGVERLEEHARGLAASQTVTSRPRHVYPLASRLTDNATILLDAYRAVAAVEATAALTPAAEWLVDNYHVVEKQIHATRTDLPPSYYRQLPKLEAGPLAGYPRVLGLAWAYVAHTDSRFAPETLRRYVRAYQDVEVLTIGELWAIAITLRIVLIENLRRIAAQITADLAACRDADILADRLLGTGGRIAEPLAAVMPDREAPGAACTVQLLHRLRDEDPRTVPAVAWLDECLARRGTTPDAIVRDQHQQQGAASVTVRNIITSLRLISEVDWTEQVEGVSLVDDALADGTRFREMDLPTRSLYRKAIEELARGSGRAQADIARDAVSAARLAERGSDAAADGREGDPGFFLLGAGRAAFAAAIGFRPSLRRRLWQLNQAAGVAPYVGAIGLVALLLLLWPMLLLGGYGAGAGLLLLFAILGAVPSLDVAVAVVNRTTAWGFGPRPLPGMALRDGVPPDLRTLVVVPMLLSSRAAMAEQIERLEVHHLASTGGDIHFALLSDFPDAPTEHMPGDATLLAAAVAGIAALNQRHAAGPGGDRFLLLHRRRRWSVGEHCWMGWERKRGKLHELNRLLRGAGDTSFVPTTDAQLEPPRDVRYVITLDADTRLPRDSARKLIGKMAHPLNRPRFDPACGRVVDGHAVIQPRVTPSLPVGSEGSLFQRISSSHSGIDPYASAVSDVYQDLFGEGSYAGKGIYDIDAFEAALAGRVPEGTLLSHDLFEGIFARAGLATDVEVVEEYPARYDVAAERQHRWARGDWQLLPWILGRGSSPPQCGQHAGAMTGTGLWKALDNLRRTVSAPATLIALLAGWTLPLPQALGWTAFVLAMIVLPTLIPVVGVIVPRRPGLTIRSHLGALGNDGRLALFLSLLTIAFLAHHAWLMADAIVRTLVRLLVTRRRLLEWVTAAQVSNGARLSLLRLHARMAAGPVAGGLALLLAGMGDDLVWLVAAPFALLWIASPTIAWWTSREPPAASRLPVPAAEALALRLAARRTWRFFEAFVTPAENALPPDNFQEDPEPRLAHRTSPTNIGLYLLAVASARDFGWLGTQDAVLRLQATFATLARMERFRGHFFNWYDTRDLRPLDPRYVSTVDSGNLAGHLIALANACEEWRGRPPGSAQQLGGIADALHVARAEAAGLKEQAPAAWQALDDTLAAMLAGIDAGVAEPGQIALRLASLGAQADTMIDRVRAFTAALDGDGAPDLLFWASAARDAIASRRRELDLPESDEAALSAALLAIADAARTMALAMEFGFLLDHDRLLLSIGYVVPEGRMDPSCYDLLASEARLASFVAIAKGDIPTRHWFRLGRAVTPVASGAALISWSGSMFEYLMPSLIMRAPARSLIEQTNRLIVRRQIDYAAALAVPWGISESAYNARDLEFTYQYSSFGVPSLGLKRGLAESIVVAPYATALAAMVDPVAAAGNFRRLAELGALGRYGFREALDYTPIRLPPGKQVAVVRAFMAHHQAMTIVAIADALLGGIMRARFHAEPMIQATELLLHERTPRDVAVLQGWAAEERAPVRLDHAEAPGFRRYGASAHATPPTQLLSNGRYTVMLTTAGSGQSRWNGMAVTRWREDATCDDHGSYVYVGDDAAGRVWSAGVQPCGAVPADYAVVFQEDRASFTRRDGDITTTLDVLVSAEDDVELRRVSVANAGAEAREITLTSYAELVLGPQAADVAHPALSKLFVTTEFLAGQGAIIATRRRRSPAEPEIWAAHLGVVEGEAVGPPTIETDRARFLGRNASLRSPLAMRPGQPLSNTTGTVLDPVFALRQRVRIAPGQVARVTFCTIVASSRGALLELVDKYRDGTAFDRAATLAWTQAQMELRHLGIDAELAGVFQRLAGHLIYTSPGLRPPSAAILRGAGGQPGLWPLGISGDLPVLLLRIDETEHLAFVRQVLQAHAYWRMKRFAVDLVILNDRASSYVQDLQTALEALVRSSQPHLPQGDAERPGRVFVVRSDLMSSETADLLAATARVVLAGRRGRLSDQVSRATDRSAVAPPAPVPTAPAARPPPVAPQLELFNGMGGFAADGREYVTVLAPGVTTPAPWINVIANPTFGFHVGAEGGGFTWALNSRENQLTPWSNDPVADRQGEAFYLRDEESGAVWSPTASPIRDPSGTYLAHHGRGYSRFRHISHGIESDLLQLVPVDDPVKISRLVLRNASARPRRLSVTAYAEWVLGPSRTATLPFVTTEIDAATGALFARNRWSPAFAERAAFLDLGGRQTEWSGDRRAFIGRNGTLAHPAALAPRAPLSRTTGAGLDPCGALRTYVSVPPGGAVEVVCLLGQAAGAEAARGLVARYRAADLDAVAAEVARQWDAILGAVQVRTPDRALDVMLNGWLLYQTLACRVWARAGFYQASGAYGFRDQLQDGMALVAARPDLTREHLLRAAARQFPEGDVQHWWLPHSGQGVRTRISDDRVWLAVAVAHYVAATGDAAVLDADLPFLEGRRLDPGEADSFFQPTVSEETATLFEHSARGLDAALAVGRHGLPLFGTGDWNDGMNAVGEGGEGESVWLGWLLHAGLAAFAPIAERRGEGVRAARWRAHGAALRAALESAGWDGAWYRRGYYDDGSPLGSAGSEACRIDSLVQSWAVLSGAADPQRAAAAMAATERELIRPQDGLALLFAPPFDSAVPNPGYIRGYPPGLRENGGQYTHAALWSVMAFAALGEGDKAGALLAMLNPINHARTQAESHRYKVEPYVIAADVYAAPGQVGRGGWTWYTGSAGWMQRAGVEGVLGVRIEGDTLVIDPCIPRMWEGFEVTLARGASRCAIMVENPDRVSRGVCAATFDGVAIPVRPLRVPFVDDGARHDLRVILGVTARVGHGTGDPVAGAAP
jgi:cyclic beta-1,2-glucan synthetase